MVTLEIGKRYVRGDGVTETIGGVTKDHAEWVWTISGNWYEQSTGRRVSYGESGSYLMPLGNWRNIEKLSEVQW